jgi:CheY-like chemotaxis protein
VLEGLLRKLGCTWVSVANGRLAVERVSGGERFDVVLMDCHMPELDGFGASTQLRALERERGWPRLKIVALTAAAFDDDRARCFEAGMDEFLAKPLELQQLISVLERCRPALALSA